MAITIDIASISNFFKNFILNILMFRIRYVSVLTSACDLVCCNYPSGNFQTPHF